MLARPRSGHARRYFVLDSLWMEAYYYLFGFAACGFALLVLAAAETAALLTYYSLCAENHRWWWRAFLAPAAAGAYVLAYAAFYYDAHLAARTNRSSVRTRNSPKIAEMFRSTPGPRCAQNSRRLGTAQAPRGRRLDGLGVLPLLRLHDARGAGRGARQRGRGLPRVAQVHELHLLADQVRLDAACCASRLRPCSPRYPTPNQ